MSTATLLPPPPAPPKVGAAIAAPEPGGPHRWTIEEYERLGELGALAPEDRVELLDGVIVDKEINDPEHADTVDELVRLFGGMSAGRWRLRNQHPVRLPDHHSLPEPDLALVRVPPGGRYLGRHPGPEDIFLLIEVSNTSQAVDRGRKLALYARAGVPEYWIVNLPERTIEAFRDPRPEAGTYARTITVRPGETLSPAAFLDAVVSVAEILGGEG